LSTLTALCMAASVEIAAASTTGEVATAHSATATPTPAPSPLTPAAVVGGIVNFTQWPAAGRPVRLCVMGDGATAHALLESGSLGLTDGSVEVLRTAVETRLGPDCKVLYLGHVGASVQQQLLSSLAEHPILTIGEGAAFCSDGGMFCLEGLESPVRFGVNIDSVSRSGLHVNPQVLWLGRRNREATPRGTP
jgi:hypothetical protein